MNNRNQQTNRTPAPVQQSLPASALSYLNVFTVEEYESNGKTQKRWTRIGAAFPHKEGPARKGPPLFCLIVHRGRQCGAQALRDSISPSQPPVHKWIPQTPGSLLQGTSSCVQIHRAK